MKHHIIQTAKGPFAIRKPLALEEQEIATIIAGDPTVDQMITCARLVALEWTDGNVGPDEAKSVLAEIVSHFGIKPCPPDSTPTTPSSSDSPKKKTGKKPSNEESSTD